MRREPSERYNRLVYGKRAVSVVALLVVTVLTVAPTVPPANASPDLPRASIHLRGCDPVRVKVVLNNTTDAKQRFRIWDSGWRHQYVKFASVSAGRKEVVRLPRETPSWGRINALDSIVVWSNDVMIALMPLASYDFCGDVKGFFATSGGRLLRARLVNWLNVRTSFTISTDLGFGVTTRRVWVGPHKRITWTRTFARPVRIAQIKWHWRPLAEVNRRTVLP